MWISTDPALGEYIPMAPTSEDARSHNQNLPGLGGVYNSVNLNLYHYAANNPVKYTDPDGRILHVAIGAGIGVVAAVGSKVISDAISGQWSSVTDYVSAAIGGATAGAVLAATGNGAAAGALGAAVADVSKSAINIAEKSINGEKINIKNELIDLAVDLAVDGAIIGDKLGYKKIPRITSGKGSFVSVANQMEKKLANGTIKNITAKTSSKMAIGRCVKGALITGTVLGNEVVGRFAQNPKQALKDYLHDKMNVSNE